MRTTLLNDRKYFYTIKSNTIIIRVRCFIYGCRYAGFFFNCYYIFTIFIIIIVIIVAFILYKSFFFTIYVLIDEYISRVSCILGLWDRLIMYQRCSLPELLCRPQSSSKKNSHNKKRPQSRVSPRYIILSLCWPKLTFFFSFF